MTEEKEYTCRVPKCLTPGCILTTDSENPHQHPLVDKMNFPAAETSTHESLRGCKALLPLGFLASDKDIPKEPRWKAGSLWDLVLAFSNCGRGTWVLSTPPFYILNSVFHKAARQDSSEVAYQERQRKADKQVNCHRLEKGKEIWDDDHKCQSRSRATKGP